MKNRPLRIIVKLICCFIIFNFFAGIGVFTMLESERSSIPPIPLFLSLFLPYFICFSKFSNKRFWKKHLYENESDDVNSYSQKKGSVINDIKSGAKTFAKNVEEDSKSAIKSFKKKSKSFYTNANKTIDNLNKNSSFKTLDKDKAIDELKKLKELLDLGILSQQEYDTKSEELKSIILGK
tara:strand:+ start:960 stop:1499 length:540 start_codon:yes stop_codon:yes gene_type:complete